MDYLRGAVVINLDADPLDYCTSIPTSAKVLGVVTCGTSAPGALLMFATPVTDRNGLTYPHALRSLIGDTMYRLPMYRTIKALKELGAGVDL
jgi:hypothetical protein